MLRKIKYWFMIRWFLFSNKFNRIKNKKESKEDFIYEDD